MNKQVLFVDSGQDEPTGARNLAKGLNDQWETTFVGSGAEALTTTKQKKYDVVISQMTLPDMVAVRLFKEVAQSNPGSVRIILTQDMSRQAALQAASCVHQCISLPCDPEDLRKTIENSLGLHRKLNNPELQARIASIKALPSPPELYTKLVAELQKDEASISKISKMIKQDIAISTKLIQLINSAFFGLRNTVDNTQQAITMLGLETVRSLVLTAGMFDQFVDPGLPGLSIKSVYDRSLEVGASARLIANSLGLRKRQIEDSLMAGMLHEVGLLILANHFPDELKQAFSMVSDGSISLRDAVQKVLGVSDSEIGAHLLSMWGLPDSILEAVALHCQPSLCPCPMMNALTTVHIAYALRHDESNRITKDKASAVDLEYLRILELSDQLPNIRNFALAAVN